MYNAATKIILALLLAAGLASCGPDARERAAQSLLGAAQAQIDLRNWQAAIDSVSVLDTNYKEQTSARRQGLRLRAQATEGLILDSISALEPVLALATLDVDATRAKVEWHEGAAAGLDGYFTAKGAESRTAVAATGFQPRVGEDGWMYLAANVAGRVIGLQQLVLRSGDASWTCGTLSPAAVLTVEGSEIATFQPESLEGLTDWLENAVPDAKALKGEFVGCKGRVNFEVKGAALEQLRDCAAFARALQNQRRASVRREKLERKLQAIRDQLANMPLPQEK